MSGAFENVLIIIEIVEFLVGTWGHGFIVLVICADWIKTKKITLLDFIFMCLAVSRISMTCLLLQDSIIMAFYPKMYEINLVVGMTLGFLWSLNNSLSNWCVTCLSVYYFLKLSNFTHPFFLWLKWRRDRVLFTILLGFFFSFFANLLSIKWNTFWIHEYLKMEKNKTWKEWLYKNSSFSHQIFLNLDALIPFFVSVTSFFLLIFSLWRHIRQMMHHTKESGHLNTEVPVRARNMMISFIILLVVHYLASVLLIWCYIKLNNSASILIVEMVALLYPSIHSFNIILGNRKVRQTFTNLLKQMESYIKRM
ncbi:PREDICTED: taste receptor type 2 member 7-like [Condylura cristata]|uniref:taste receptor type 2 member 7-like n=1 Tax=Condylura cristata TaxID=143302 RepID=UPI00033466C6|nr:PREDICTED: taste receptor type 2 member 7-like [Condylura cristata]